MSVRPSPQARRATPLASITAPSRPLAAGPDETASNGGVHTELPDASTRKPSTSRLCEAGADWLKQKTSALSPIGRQRMNDFCQLSIGIRSSALLPHDNVPL